MAPVSLSSLDWSALVSVPIEWAALALLVAGAIYWERSALSGIGIEGAFLAAVLGICLGYEWTGDYGVASALGVGGALVFALVTSGLVLSLKADPTVGSFCMSLLPACVLGLLTRTVPLRLLHETPAPGLVPGTIFEGTYAEDLVVSPWFLLAPFVLGLAALVMLKTPYGLRLRGYSETPAYARRGPWQVAWFRVSGAVLGSLVAVPGAALMLRAHADAPPMGLGLIALACAVAARWGFLPGILLALGPALLRSLRPYAAADSPAGLLLQAAPFLLALLYLVFLSRRALRAGSSAQSRLDPDVL